MKKITKKDEIDNKNIGISTGLEYGKIINWNLFFNVNLNLQYLKDQCDNGMKGITNPEKNNRYISSLHADFYYQFNSRSFIKLSNQFHFESRDSNRKKEDALTLSVIKNQETYEAIIDPHFVYFITPKFMIDSSLPISYAKQWKHRFMEDGVYDETDKQKNVSFSLLIGYYL